MLNIIVIIIEFKILNWKFTRYVYIMRNYFNLNLYISVFKQIHFCLRHIRANNVKQFVHLPFPSHWSPICFESALLDIWHWGVTFTLKIIRNALWSSLGIWSSCLSMPSEKWHLWHLFGVLTDDFVDFSVFQRDFEKKC